MADIMTPTIYKPVWIDLSTSDPAAARDFYARLFGWQVEVDPDPQYGGYAMARLGGKGGLHIGDDGQQSDGRRLEVVAARADVGKKRR